MDDKLSSIALVNVWMGEFPDYFYAWLISTNGNPTVDFYIFTNAWMIPDVPPNVHIISTTFDEVRARIQKSINFTIKLDSVRKLCDYKPAYGEAFRDYLKDYDFWGYCDIDLIWGNIRKFFTEDILKKHERIFGCGHLTIMKNNEKVNQYYRTMIYPGALDYREVYTVSKTYGYDEFAEHLGGGTSIIMLKNGIPMFLNDEWRSTAEPFKSRFFYKPIGWFYVEYDSGNLYLKRGNKVLKENLYYHYDERKRFNKTIGQFDWKKDSKFYYISPATLVDARSFKKEYELGRTVKYALRLILRRLYMAVGEPQWEPIKKMLK